MQPPRGGAPVLVELLAREQLSSYDVGAVCRPRVAKRLAGSGVRTWAVPMVRAIRPLHDGADLVRLLRVVKRFEPHVIHAHSSKAGALGRAAGGIAGIPVVYSPHNFPFMAHEGGRLIRGIWLAAERAMAPLTAELHLTYSEEKEVALRHGLAPPDRVSVVHNCTDITPLLAIEPRRGSIVTIGTYARLWPQKRIDLLLHAAAGVARGGLEFRIEIIGEGPLRPELESLAGRLGLAGRTAFLDDPGSAAAAMSRLDIFVLSSSEETYPLTVMEAMAAGRPVIATTVGALPEMIDPNRTGLLVPSGDRQALEEAIRTLVADTRLTEELGAAAREHARGNFDIARMAAGLDPVYRAAAKCSRTSVSVSARS